MISIISNYSIHVEVARQQGHLFKLETPVTVIKAESQGLKRRNWLHDSIVDKCGF